MHPEGAYAHAYRAETLASDLGPLCPLYICTDHYAEAHNRFLAARVCSVLNANVHLICSLPKTYVHVRICRVQVQCFFSVDSFCRVHSEAVDL